MIALYRVSKNLRPFQVNCLDDKLTSLGYRLDPQGAYYNKQYKSPRLNLGIICDSSNVYDLMANAVIENKNIDRQISDVEKIYQKNLRALATLNMVKMAQGTGLGGFGLEGGSGGLHNMNLSEEMGGSRWWLYSDDTGDLDEMSAWLQGQFRYNPTYLSIGKPIQIGDDEYTVLAHINDDVKGIRFDRDRQEMMLDYIDGNNQIHKFPVNSIKHSTEMGKYDGDFAQDLKKYQLKLSKLGDKHFVVLIRKSNTSGDLRGIWEVNGRDQVPGFAYIDEDYKTSYSLHPELLNDKDWASGASMPGRDNYLPSGSRDF